jgi:hypothetical protein
LDQEEFILAMFLINCKRKGMNIPEFDTTVTAKPPSTKARTTKQASSSLQWKITEEDKNKYTDMFNRIQPDGDCLTGKAARELFDSSGLARNDMAKIWRIADVDQDGTLNQLEFIFAMHFINRKLKGVEIPDFLPESMMVDVRRLQEQENQRKEQEKKLIEQENQRYFAEQERQRLDRELQRNVLERHHVQEERER